MRGGVREADRGTGHSFESLTTTPTGHHLIMTEEFSLGIAGVAPL